jgi:HD superfamily phosphohydrolase
MEIATRAFDALSTKHRKKVEDELAKLPELEDRPLIKGRQVVRMLALLHDIGHPAFSHAAETALSVKDHEQVSNYVIRDILGELLDGRLFPGMSNLLVRLMGKNRRSPSYPSKGTSSLTKISTIGTVGSKNLTFCSY